MESEVWILSPRRNGKPDPTVVGTVRRAAQAKGWADRLVRPKVLRDSAGKPLYLLDPETASNMYQRAHRVRLAALSTTDVWVRLNPSRYRLDGRYLAKTSRVLRYKAFCRRISERGVDETMKAFEAWSHRVECDNERDPRVLPLHTFAPLREWTTLRSDGGRADFTKEYGGATSRTCEQGLTWSPDRARHGREPQNVAGYEIIAGYHWDVSDDRKSRRLLTLTDVWEIPRRDHANVYPNGYIRAGGKTRKVDTVRQSGAKDDKPRPRK